jgi:hypothetical protein
MVGAIKPTSVEGYLIRLYDTCEHLTQKMAAVESKMDGMVAEDKRIQEIMDQRIIALEARVNRAESQNLGAKDVKSSITPYVIAFASALFAFAGYVILHFVGIK